MEYGKSIGNMYPKIRFFLGLFQQIPSFEDEMGRMVINPQSDGNDLPVMSWFTVYQKKIVDTLGIA